MSWQTKTLQKCFIFMTAVFVVFLSVPLILIHLRCAGGFVELEYISWCDKVAIDNMRPVAPGRRYSAVLNDRRVRMASQLLINNEITPVHFLHQASPAIHAAALHGLRIGDDEDSDEDSDLD